MKNDINVLLVDDHVIFREGITSLLNQVDNIHVVGGLNNGEDAVSSYKQYSPDIILMDIVMRGMSGVEATRWIKEQDPDVKVILISSEIRSEYISNGIKCGIDGYLPKDADKQMLIEAIRTVHTGGKYFNQAIVNLVFNDFCKSEKEGVKRVKKVSDSLSKRETEVLQLVAEGRTNQEVADLLFISVKTVETHKTHILEKLGLKNTAELVRYAIKQNIITLD
jgi:DNA-binding NarL/FixJ family response regulator